MDVQHLWEKVQLSDSKQRDAYFREFCFKGVLINKNWGGGIFL